MEFGNWNRRAQRLSFSDNSCHILDVFIVLEEEDGSVVALILCPLTYRNGCHIHIKYIKHPIRVTNKTSKKNMVVIVLLMIVSLTNVQNALGFCPVGCTCISSQRVVCADSNQIGTMRYSLTTTTSTTSTTATTTATTTSTTATTTASITATTTVTTTAKSLQLNDINNTLMQQDDEKKVVYTCGKNTCPRNSQCFEVHGETPICRCTMGLVKNTEGKCVYGIKLFLVDGLALKMKFSDHFSNTSSIEFVAKAEQIRTSIDYFLSHYSSVQGSQVTRLDSKRTNITHVQFVLSANTSTYTPTDVDRKLITQLYSNDSIMEVDRDKSKVSVQYTDMCVLRGELCDAASEQCTYNATSGTSGCTCAEGFERDDIDDVCANESSEMEFIVVIPVCCVVVLLLCVGGYLYNRRYNATNYTRSSSNRSAATFSNTSF